MRAALLLALALAGCAPATDSTPTSCDGGDCGVHAVCPPPGPFGFGLGEQLTDLAFDDCDGDPVRLHDLCGARAGLVVTFYGWCPPCYRNVEMADTLHEKHRARGLSTLVVVVEDSLRQPASRDYCRQAREALGLSAVVVHDPGRAIEQYGTTDLAMVTDPSATIAFKRRDADEALVVSAVEQMLAR